MRATEFITELFEPKAPTWEWMFRGSEEATADFQVGEIPYRFHAYSNGENDWEVEFKVRTYDRSTTARKTRFGLTGTGNSAEVMSTVVDIMREFLEMYRGKIDTIGFTAEEPSRQKLYMRMMKRLLPNWDIHTYDSGSGLGFTVVAPDNLTEEINTPNILYHVTPTSNVKSILAKGLVPSIGQRSAQLETESNLYFFPSKEAAEDAVMNWLGDELPEDEQLALLAVSSKGLEGKFTPGAEYEYTVSSSVPPQNIKVISTNF